jgi:glycolate oxidase iron-sulfur subunit
VFLHKTNTRTIELLSKAGAEVIIPDTQTCCGAIHAHSGKRDASIQLAKQNIEVFERENVDYIVNNAGGCGARLVEYDELFHGDPEWQLRAQRFVEKTRDISEVLVELNSLKFTNPLDEVVTYQASCHMLNVQHVSEPPLELLASVPGITYRKMKGSDRCCGSAGIYNILNYEDAVDILDEKMSHTRDTKAHTVVTTNPGCLLQMKLGIEREGLGDQMRAVHLVDLLTEAKPRQKQTAGSAW